MCFHTSTTKSVSAIENRFDVALHESCAREAFDIPNYHLNGFSHPIMLTIIQHRPELLVNGRWGIVPKNTNIEDVSEYYKKAVRFGGGLNAQSEKAFEHFIYKGAIKNQRCIIPVTGFFEPHDKEGTKYPVYISRKDKDLIGMAGIYTVIGSDKEKMVTFSILTKAASPLFEEIHNLKKRQPILLSKEYERPWLDNQITDLDIQKIIEVNYPDQELQAYSVNRDLFKPQVNSDIPQQVEKQDGSLIFTK